MNKTKILLIISLVLSLPFMLVSCDTSTTNPPEKPPVLEGPWDDLGGGGQGDQTDESGITSGDAGKNEEVENPDDSKFESGIENAINIDLNNLVNDSNDYKYEDNILTLEKEGTYALTGNLNGAVVVKGDATSITVVLYNANIYTLDTQSIPAITFEKNSGERILSVYENTVNNLSDSIFDDESGDGAIIQAKKSSLIVNGTGTLNLVSKGAEVTALKVKNDLKIFSVTLNITTSDHGIKAGELLSVHSANINIIAKGDGMKTDVEAESEEEAEEFTSNPYAGYIYIENSNITIDAGDDGISANSLMKINNAINNTITVKTNGGAPSYITESSSDNSEGKAIKVDGITLVIDDTETDLLSKCENNYALYILGGTFIINSNSDAISSKGNLVIDNGNFDITSGDDGIHAEYITKINDGNITIKNSYEAIEGAAVEIYGGTFNVTSVDDGVNAANADLVNYPYNIYIGGGNLEINAQGDGVDSNGTIEFAGGTTIIYGPTSGANAALDADRGILVNGGILVAFGPLGMIETPSSNSKQCSIVYSLSGSANSAFNVKDENGNVLFETTVPKQYQCVVVSLPDFVIGSTYSLSSNTSTQNVTIQSILTNGAGGGMGPGPGGRPPGGRPR